MQKKPGTGKGERETETLFIGLEGMMQADSLGKI